MAQLYQVVFTGELKSGANAEQAARDFAAVFKVPEEKAWKLVLDRSPHVLKRDIDEANAARYRDILDEIGLEVRVEESGRPAHHADSGDAAAAAPSHNSTSSTVACRPGPRIRRAAPRNCPGGQCGGTAELHRAAAGRSDAAKGR